MADRWNKDITKLARKKQDGTQSEDSLELITSFIIFRQLLKQINTQPTMYAKNE